MKGTSKEYAAALFRLAQEGRIEKEISQGLEFVSCVFSRTPEMYSFLKAPGISKNERLDVVKNAFEEAVPEYVLSFLCLLCENGNIDCLNDCVEEFNMLYESYFSRSRAKVISAVELNSAEKKKLCESLEKKFGRKIEIEYTVDSGILGGIIIETDGTVIDGSLKTRLNTMKGVMSQ